MMWVNEKKASFANIASTLGWPLDIPSQCKQFCLMDCICLGAVCRPSRMLEVGLTFHNLLSLYKMEYQQMVMFGYSMQDWVALGLDFQSHCMEMDHNTFFNIFGTDHNSGLMLFQRIQTTREQFNAPADPRPKAKP